MSCWFISQNYCNVCVGNINWKCEECEPLFETFPKKPGPCVLSFRNSVRHFIKIYKVIVQYVPKFNTPSPPLGNGGGGCFHPPPSLLIIIPQPPKLLLRIIYMIWKACNIFWNYTQKIISSLLWTMIVLVRRSFLLEFKLLRR